MTQPLARLLRSYSSHVPLSVKPLWKAIRLAEDSFESAQHAQLYRQLRHLSRERQLPFDLLAGALLGGAANMRVGL